MACLPTCVASLAGLACLPAWHLLGLRHLLAMIRSTSLPVKHFLGLRTLIRSTKRVSKLCLGLHNLSDAHKMTVRPRRVCPSTWTGPQRLSSLSPGLAEVLPNLSMSLPCCRTAVQPFHVYAWATFTVFLPIRAFSWTTDRPRLQNCFPNILQRD